MSVNLIERLAGGDRKSIGKAPEVAKEALASPHRLPELIAGILGDDPIVRARSAVAVKLVALDRPELVQPFKKQLLKEISVIDQWEVREQFAIILPKLKLSSREINEAVEIFKNYLNYYSSIVRTCAMQALVDLSEIQPGLKDEVRPIIEDLTANGTAAMRARGRKLLKVLARNE